MSKKQVINKPKVAALPADPFAQRKLKITLGIIIGVFAFILYAQSISFNYTMDDHPAIDQNKITKQGFAGIPTLLTTDYWYGYQEDVRGPVYRPTSLIIFAMVWQFSPDSPHIYHFINVLFYAITCMVLYLLLCELFKKQKLLLPFVCSLLYAAHPIHTEVINNIKSLDEILCFLFGITATYFILKYLSAKSIITLIVGGISFFLSLISKETGITFLVIIPLIIYFFTDTSWKKTLTVCVVLIVISIVYLLIRSIVLGDVHMNVSNSVLNNTLVAAPNFISREVTVFYILLRYLLLLVFPHPLSCDYNFSEIKIQTVTDPLALFGLLLFTGLGIYSIINLRKKSMVGFGILFFLITIAPVSNVFLLIGSTMAERFLYIPSLGYCFILTYFLINFTKVNSIKSNFQSLAQAVKLNPTLFACLLVVLGLYSFKTYSRSADWKDNYTIFNHDAEVSVNSATAHFNKGYELIVNLYGKEKNIQTKNNYNDIAIEEFTKAINIYPYYSEFYFKLANCYYNKDDYKSALLNYEKAMRLTSKTTPKVFRDLASIYDKTNQFDKELNILDSAIKYTPDSAGLHNDKGCVFFSLKRYNDAINEYQKAIILNPKLAIAYKNMGSSFINIGNYKQALETLSRSGELDSSDAETFKFIGLIYQAEGNSINAKKYFEKANSITVQQQR